MRARIIFMGEYTCVCLAHHRLVYHVQKLSPHVEHVKASQSTLGILMYVEFSEDASQTITSQRIFVYVCVLCEQCVCVLCSRAD